MSLTQDLAIANQEFMAIKPLEIQAGDVPANPGDAEFQRKLLVSKRDKKLRISHSKMLWTNG
ncbi:hypothetical protein [Paenibacillus sp. FSL K6-2862]|uniref:hypothetical protein n=1 Tax=Paenibacillus sp. FSL K6-2862 TaxID=2921484 RepID=UPI0030F93E92